MAMKSIQLNYEKNIAYYDDKLGQQHIREVMMENDFEKMRCEMKNLKYGFSQNIMYRQKDCRCRSAYSLAQARWQHGIV